jgi:DNA-binding response OmpR family regulator
MTRVLLIEDDRQIRQLLQTGLRARGFTVTAAASGSSAVELLRTRAVDLVLLDLVLHDVDGFALLAAIRARRPLLSVIALVAREDERAQVQALDGGADDYVTIPFSVADVAARIRARLRRRGKRGTLVQVGPLALDLASHRASLGQHSALLSARESSLLAAFIHRAGEVLARDELLHLVWEIEFDPGSNVVDVYVASLRRKLGAEVIETVRGRGYRLRIHSPRADNASSSSRARRG